MAYGSALVDTIQSSTAGAAPQFKDGNGTQVGTLCRAWVNFNPNNPVVVNASFNVSSVTRTATGAFTVSFTNAMPDANYSAVLGGRGAAATTSLFVENNDTVVRTSTQIAVYSLGSAFVPTDGNTKYSVSIFR